MNKEKKSELIKTLGWSGLTCFGGLGAFRYADVADLFVAVAIFLVIMTSATFFIKFFTFFKRGINQ